MEMEISCAMVVSVVRKRKRKEMHTRVYMLRSRPTIIRTLERYCIAFSAYLEPLLHSRFASVNLTLVSSCPHSSNLNIGIVRVLSATR
jgi:hypothetical protein